MDSEIQNDGGASRSKFKTIVADPPWPIAARMGAGGRRRRATVVPYALLASYVERKKCEARRKWPHRMTGPTGRELGSYWEGQYVALVKLQRRLERIVKAQPNDRRDKPESQICQLTPNNQSGPPG